MKTTITFEIDTEALAHYTDAYLAQLWHIAQANPADDFAAREPGQLAEEIGREIIRRWLAATPPDLWRVQGRHAYIGEMGYTAADTIRDIPGEPA